MLLATLLLVPGYIAPLETIPINVSDECLTSGCGDTRAFSFKAPSEVNLDEQELNSTISEILANENFTTINIYAQQHINANLHALLSEITLGPKEVIYVPTLFPQYEQ
ncbi:uncharacterized protein N7473_001615 [Penicillium subrubescens]|uniref:Protein-arginine deiminase C-terminal domain-containing protein n=1 Tax=Penicillium subrubescens TaxID=1316194 RepID=A0A1Q5UAN9_9EURO|nr:uncharacterized protein N7473_001615 [Penicillium subrubescens]KAJ5904699.1 hypothetical protein N7473_001615 [Penicillium subrubescens]OKP09537.1 hypothetical protein PENSUB_5101 [Penicillium subrubescens]